MSTTVSEEPELSLEMEISATATTRVSEAPDPALEMETGGIAIMENVR